MLASGGIVAALTLSAVETMDRNEVFGRSAEPYRALAEDLPRVVPEVAKGSRFIIYYGVWDGSVVWQDAVVQTVYKDRTLKTVNIDAARTDTNVITPQTKDVVLFYSERGFIRPALPARTPTPNPATSSGTGAPE